MSEEAAKSRRHVYFMVKEPDAPDRILILDTQELTIGRSNESDLQAKYAEVSRRHAVLKRDGQKYSVQNLSTSSGTIVNGAAVQHHPLSARSDRAIHLPDSRLRANLSSIDQSTRTPG
jgi:pSer/pThr/pTyr-binding forkhead associated (FHA) protein